MRCYVYRSAFYAGAYIYVSNRPVLELLPPGLAERFLPAEPVMELVLTPQRRLAKESAQQVLANLLAQGFHLQLSAPAIRLGAEPALSANIR